MSILQSFSDETSSNINEVMNNSDKNYASQKPLEIFNNLQSSSKEIYEKNHLNSHLNLDKNFFVGLIDPNKYFVKR